MKQISILIFTILTLFVSSQQLTKVSYEYSENQNTVVYICNSKSSYTYHLSECKRLGRCKSGISKISLSDAKSRGYSPCKTCYN